MQLDCLPTIFPNLNSSTFLTFSLRINMFYISKWVYEVSEVTTLKNHVVNCHWLDKKHAMQFPRNIQ